VLGRGTFAPPAPAASSARWTDDWGGRFDSW